MSGAVPLLSLSICFHGVDMDTFISAVLTEVFFVVSLSSCMQTSYGTANYATTVLFHILTSSSFSVPPVTGHIYYELLATSLNVPRKGRAVPARAIKKPYRWNRGVALPLRNFRIRWE